MDRAEERYFVFNANTILYVENLGRIDIIYFDNAHPKSHMSDKRMYALQP